jgi:phage regulator Rha-like protein
MGSISKLDLGNSIFTIRGCQVMIDFQLAELYDVETKRINEQVKRNIKRFPEHFMFQLHLAEWDQFQKEQLSNRNSSFLRSQFATAKRRTLPYVFTEQGVAMLSAVLSSETAIQTSIQIMGAFVEMRKILLSHSGLIQRMDGLERKQIETEQKFERVFQALEQNTIPTQGVFFDGQVFDAYALCSRIIRSANKRITLIDNYIDESTLVHLSKKREGVTVRLLTKTTHKQLQLDLQKANEQYGGFELKSFHKSHDRFLIIDDQEVYHLGASLKDLGKRWFAFSKLDKSSVNGLLNMI